MDDLPDLPTVEEVEEVEDSSTGANLMTIQFGIPLKSVNEIMKLINDNDIKGGERTSFSPAPCHICQ